MTPQSRARLKMWLVLCSVFGLGAMTGGALDRVHCLRQHQGQHEVRGRRERGAERFFQALQGELALSEEQSSAVRRIIDKTRAEYRALREEVRPRYEAVRQRERAAIRALLTEDQQHRFDQLTERFDARHREQGRGEERIK